MKLKWSEEKYNSIQYNPMKLVGIFDYESKTAVNVNLLMAALVHCKFICSVCRRKCTVCSLTTHVGPNCLTVVVW